MSRKKTNANSYKPDDHPPKSDSKSSPSIKEAIADSDTTQKCNNCQENKPILVEAHVNDQKKWNRIDYIAFWALLVNLALAVFTYRLYSISAQTAKLAITADSAAVAAIQLNKDQFRLLNEPYLEMIDVSFNSSHEGKITLGYRIKNLNNIVVNQFKQGDTVIYRDNKHVLSVGENYLDSIPDLSYRNEMATFNSTLKEVGVPLFSQTVYSDDFYKNYKDANGHYYFLGRIYYSSDMSTKNRIYEYCFEMIYQKNEKGRVGYVSIYTKNRYE